MLNILTKSAHIVLILLTIVLVLPGLVTVIGFMVAVVGHSCGYSINEMQTIIDIVNSVWRLYGLIQ